MPNAIITGATQGIGKAIAEKLLAQGFSIAICSRTEQELEAVKQSWKSQYPEANVVTCKADVGVRGALLAFAQQALAAFGSIDILVNNAGIFYPGQLMQEPDGHLEQLMNVNLYSAYYLTRAIIPYMNEGGKGHIFNICSVASLRAYPNGGSYSITKYALLGFSENLREEYKGRGIRVTAICPGATNSRSWEGAGVENDRIMDADDVAEVLWSAYSLSSKANVETIVMRPAQGDL